MGLALFSSCRVATVHGVSCMLGFKSVEKKHYPRISTYCGYAWPQVSRSGATDAHWQRLSVDVWLW